MSTYPTYVFNGNVSSQQGFYVTNTTGTNAVIQADTNKNVDISAGTTANGGLINFFRDTIKTGPNNANGYIRLDNTNATASQTASLSFVNPAGTTTYGSIYGTSTGLTVSGGLTVNGGLNVPGTISMNGSSVIYTGIVASPSSNSNLIIGIGNASAPYYTAVATFSSSGLNLTSSYLSVSQGDSHTTSCGFIQINNNGTTTGTGTLGFYGPTTGAGNNAPLYGYINATAAGMYIAAGSTNVATFSSGGLVVNGNISANGAATFGGTTLGHTTANSITINAGTPFTASEKYRLYNSPSSSYITTGISTSTTFGILCGAYDILCSSLFYYSDQRIKKNIKSVNTSSLLETLNTIQLRNFNYIDTIVYGTQTELGFIAQEVKDIYPNAVTTHKSELPSIYTIATNVQLSLDGKNVVITVIIPSTINLVVGGSIRLLIENKKEKHIAIVVSFTESQLVVPIWEDFNLIDNIFVYGPVVDDCHGVDETQFISLCMGGVQELSKRNDVLTAQVSALQLQVNTLMQQMATVLAKN